jgi:hypothetical protein
MIINILIIGAHGKQKRVAGQVWGGLLVNIVALAAYLSYLFRHEFKE